KLPKYPKSQPFAHADPLFHPKSEPLVEPHDLRIRSQDLKIHLSRAPLGEHPLELLDQRAADPRAPPRGVDAERIQPAPVAVVAANDRAKDPVVDGRDEEKLALARELLPDRLHRIVVGLGVVEDLPPQGDHRLLIRLDELPNRHLETPRRSGRLRGERPAVAL